MTDADAFLEAIWAAPVDDLPRLVYADWLEEQGQATYAEFIRLDCLLARQEPQTPLERGRLRQRRHDLRTKLANEWKDAVGDRGGWMLHESSRGLFEPTVYIDSDEFLRLSPHWWPRLPIRVVHVRAVDGREAELARAPYLSRVRDLIFGYPRETEHGWEHPDELIARLAGATHLTRLQFLAYGPVMARPATLRVFGRAMFLPQLDNGGLFIRVIMSENPGADGRLVYADIDSRGGSAAGAIDRFLDEYGDRVFDWE